MSAEKTNILKELDIEYRPGGGKESSPPDGDFGEMTEILKSVKRANMMDFGRVTIYYADDVWDFGASGMVTPSFWKFNFSGLPDGFKDDLKGYVFITVITDDRIKLQTLKKRATVLKKLFFTAYLEGCECAKDLTPEILEDFFANKDASERYLMDMKEDVKQFFLYYNANFEEIFGQKFFDFLDYDRRAVRAERENAKTPDIPQKFFKNTIINSWKILNNEEESDFNRGMAALIIMESQLGLRTGEILALKAGCIHETALSDGRAAYYLTYETSKRARGSGATETVETYANELVRKACRIVEKIFAGKREAIGEPYLFLLRELNVKNNYPITSVNMCDLMNRYFVYLDKYFPTVTDEKVYPQNLNCCRVKENLYVTRPDITQFRVHVCTELYKRGYPLEAIRHFLSHLYNYATIHYARADEDTAQKLEAANVLREPTFMGEKLMTDKINEFLENGKIRIAKDLEELTKIQNNPVRVKAGGACARPQMIMECFSEKATNAAFCDYGTDNAPEEATERLLQTIARISKNIELNRNAGRDVSKELEMLRRARTNLKEAALKAGNEVLAARCEKDLKEKNA